MKALGYAVVWGVIGGCAYAYRGGLGLVIVAFAVLVWGLLVCEDRSGRQL